MNVAFNSQAKETAVAWTIGGSDSCAGAGIQADLKTMQGLGVHGCSVITSITAQNTARVGQVEAVSAEMIRRQLSLLAEDLHPKVIKLGMLYSTEVIDVVADFLERHSFFVVCDPVMVSTSGDILLEQESREHFRKKILPLVDLLTPNLPESQVLLAGETNFELHDDLLPQQIEVIAKKMLVLGAKQVLVKGGHRPGAFCQDYFFDGKDKWWLTSPRQGESSLHGTGCTLSAAISAALTRGYPLLDAIVIAKAYVNQSIRHSYALGAGSRLLAHQGWPECHDDLPVLTPDAPTAKQRLHFEEAGELGLYPIVSNIAALGKAIGAGIKTVQLRIKAPDGLSLEQELELSKAISMARQSGCHLYINDHWREAVKLGAWGVHLGQEDLEKADLSAIASSGLRLGISTHCYAEVARALAINPSYIAIGPIFHTTTKVMKFAPQGVSAFKLWRKTLKHPLVAIGGIFLSNALEIIEAGADGIAVVRALENARDYDCEVMKWHALLGKANQRKLVSNLANDFVSG